MDKIFLNKTRQSLRILIFAIAIVNVALFYTAFNHLSIEYSLVTAFVGLPIIGFLLSIFIALIPFNKLSYGDRRTKITYILIFFLEVLFLLGNIFSIIFRWLGWRV